MPFPLVKLLLSPVEVKENFLAALVRDVVEVGEAPEPVFELSFGRDIFCHALQSQFMSKNRNPVAFTTKTARKTLDIVKRNLILLVQLF